MGYFDALTDGSFKKIEDGRIAFYPWGVLGAGYILPNDEAHCRIRRFVKWYLLVSLPLAIALVAFVGLVSALLAFPVFLAVYLIRLRPLIHGLPVASDRLSLAESYRNQARGHSWVMLWALEAGSLLFVAVES